MKYEEYEKSPPSVSTRLVNFDKAEVTPGIVPGTWFLSVSGVAPCLNMEVRLDPMVYVTCPEYWGIEVTGTLPQGLCITAVKPFHVSIPLAGITGSKGIEVIGANKADKIDVAGGNCS